MNFAETFVNSLGSFLARIALFIPNLLLAILLWIIGRWLIGLMVNLIDKLDLKQYQIDDRFRNLLKSVLVPVANVLLFLIVLDTFGIGSSVIAAITNGITFTVAIALGMAFGKALEPEARSLVDQFRSGVEEKREAVQ